MGILTVMNPSPAIDAADIAEEYKGNADNSMNGRMDTLKDTDSLPGEY
jgi:hypothetical protein